MNRNDDFAMGDTGELIEGYLEMSRDATRELDAKEWSEGLIDDPPAVPIL